MKISKVLKKLNSIYAKYGDIDFGSMHYPAICRVEHPSYVPIGCIEVVNFRCQKVGPEERGYKIAVARSDKMEG